MSMLTIIGRGHSGTRAIAQTLYASGVYMGELLNPTGDMMPPDRMYDACRMISRHVRWDGDLAWNFDALHTMPIPPQFTQLVRNYLLPLLKKDLPQMGWKLPETTLAYPWLVRLFPDLKYIFWVRNPRDCILSDHLTDDLARFGIRYPATNDARRMRAISWKYQDDLVRATPKPRMWLLVRFEDFVLRHNDTCRRLEEFLEIPLARIPVNPKTIDRWKQDTGVNYFEFFAPAMREYGYELPGQ